MALGVNTNIASLNAQRNLTRSQDTLNAALQRLSTGLRINSAKDDAAGLAISTRFTTQINGLNQAVRNANDGISLVQTGEAALAEITNNLQRVRELAVQSANATNSVSDRVALDLEVQQRLAEISRIGSQTTFNGQRILDGSFGTANFQVGANVGDTISIGLNQGVKSSQIGSIAQVDGAVVDGNGIAAGALTIALGTGNAVIVGASVAGSDDASQSATSAYAVAAAIKDAGISGLGVTAATADIEDVTFTDGTNSLDEYTLEINGIEVYSETTDGTLITAEAVVTGINAFASETGVTASLSGDDITFSAVQDGGDIEYYQSYAFFDVAGGLAGSFTREQLGTITLTAADAITIAGAGVAGAGFTAGTEGADTSQTLVNANVNSVSNANTTIQRADAALTAISDLRSTFGAIQSRFESTIANLQTVSENLSASRSRILDADFAAETASLTRSQILQQAGISVLSQANAIPQNVLALLQ